VRFIFNIPRTTTCYRWFGIFIALAIGCSLPSSAQVATILGTITDPSGAAVPNVTVTVRNTDTNQITRFTRPEAHRVVNFVYQIPLLRNSSNHLLKATVGGWELSGIVTAQTGTPLNIGCTSTCGASYATVANVFPGGDVLVRPDLAGPVSYPKTVNAWFSGSSFAAPAAGTWGNLGFNALRGPGRQTRGRRTLLRHLDPDGERYLHPHVWRQHQ